MTREQANFIYKKMESGEMINTESITTGIRAYQRQLNKIDEMTQVEIHDPYKELISKQCRENRTTVNTNGTVVNFEQHTKLHTV